MQTIDYRSFNNPYSTTQNPYANRWWLADKSERAQAVMSVLKAIAEYDSRRQTQYQISVRLYGNVNLMGINGLSYSKIQAVQGNIKDRLTYNVCQSVVDTIQSKIAKNKPKPLFLTSGGQYKIQKRAKNLEKFIDGIFYENDAYKLGSNIFRDGCVAGDGLVHVFKKDGRIKYERALASELFVDWVDGFYGHPRQLHRVKNIDRQVLIEAFPDKEELIMRANSASSDLLGVNRNVADQVTVAQSWHLKSGPDAKDGLNTINIAEGNLFEEEWDKDYFPFAKYTWSPRLYGYWGQGLVEQVQNIQLEINKILWVIQRSFHLAGSFKVFLEHGSKIVTEKINNDIGAIVSYSGKPPQYVVPQIVASEMYTFLMALKNAAYEQAGISQLSAFSQKPAGLNSGKALREFNDIETDRFQVVGQAYEDFYLQLARLTVDCAKDLADDGEPLQVKVNNGRFIESIDWKDVNLDKDEFIMKIYPVSSLPTEPAGRLQTIQEYIQAGFLNPATGRKLLDFPDLEQVEDLANAQEDYLNKVLEKIIDEGVMISPEPFDNLKMARELALQYYASAKLQGIEEEKLELIRNFLGQIDILEKKALEGLQPNPDMAANVPQAVPMPSPVSDLIPNVPMS